jgi:PDZ domain-containing protein
MINAGTAPETVLPTRRHRWLWWVVGALVAVLGIALGVAALYTVPYYAVSPGSVWPTDHRVSVDGAPAFASEGQIGFTTVSVSSEPTSALEAFFGWLDPAVDLMPEEVYLGDDTPEENQQRNAQYMTDSKLTATAVALETLGYDVADPYGARMVTVDEDLPAAEVLASGDLVVGIDGGPVEDWVTLVDALGEKEPGDEIELEIVTFEEQQAQFERLTAEGSLDLDPDSWARETRDVTLAEREDDPSTSDDDDLPPAVLGVTGEDAIAFDFPIDVQIDSGRVGGPSAGLAFTLSVLDVLTEEDLTGGHLVATTGTIALDGTVGPVGGVYQKTIAARRAGVELFLVPSAEYDEALSIAGDMRVERADTLEEALAALESLGADTEELQAAAHEVAPAQ